MLRLWTLLRTKMYAAKMICLAQSAGRRRGSAWRWRPRASRSAQRPRAAHAGARARGDVAAREMAARRRGEMCACLACEGRLQGHAGGEIGGWAGPAHQAGGVDGRTLDKQEASHLQMATSAGVVQRCVAPSLQRARRTQWEMCRAAERGSQGLGFKGRRVWHRVD